MPDQIKLNDRTRTVEIRSRGAVTFEDISSTIESVLEIQRTKGYSRVLVDAREQDQMPSLIALYKLFNSLEISDMRVAVVVDNGQGTANENKFIETLALNRGLQIRVFFYERKARRWLTIPVRKIADGMRGASR